mmetsp:Transcript_12820/g.21704  ORF Transcript_12820/g.21704 Transcript_12820/m.21704 type:complete len:311 (-) Transcript_12820:283-1215(-)
MQSSETYFMLGARHKEPLNISDPIVQQFYVELFSSLALQKENSRQYLGMLGKIDNGLANQADTGVCLYPFIAIEMLNSSKITEVQRMVNESLSIDPLRSVDYPQQPKDEGCDLDEDSDLEDDASLDSVGQRMYKKQKKVEKMKTCLAAREHEAGGPEQRVDGVTLEGPQRQPENQIYMVQHYSKEHNAFVQYIKNDSRSLACITKMTVQYRNMLQMGDEPQLRSFRFSDSRAEPKDPVISVRDEDEEGSRIFHTDENKPLVSEGAQSKYGGEIGEGILRGIGILDDEHPEEVEEEKKTESEPIETQDIHG